MIRITNENEVSVKPDIDWLGIILLTIGIGSLQYVLERGETEDWYDSIYIRWLSCTALAGIIGFIWWELRQKHPVVNLHIMKSRSLSLTTILTFVSGFALYTSVYVFPLLLQRVLGYTAFETGIAILPTSLLFIIVMPILGRILQSGAKPTMFVFFGFVALILFGILMFRTDINVSSSFFALPLMARAMGLALLMAPLTSMAVQGLKPVDIPQGIALNNMMRQLGGSLGIAMINNYINQRYAIHRMDLITNIYDGSNQLAERTSLLMQGLQSKLSVSANIQQQAYSAINLSVMKQSYLLTYLDAFLFSSVCILVVLPLIFMARNKSIPQ